MCGCASRDNRAMYAVPAFECDASMTLTAAGGSLGGVTFAHVRPLSRVTWMRPVLVPTQMRPAATVDGASDWIEPPGAGPLTLPPPADADGWIDTPGGAARSGLIARQVRPRSFDASTRWL